ncbi:MAG: GNAT family N-acetyltransferase [Alphaproteobacteria bacterium]|nr:GNAT family N-acetyltransferase [Alphaproteobacteria bacterium]
MAAPVRVERLSGPAILERLDDLARLRIEVFRDYPYLYQGSMDYERRYLGAYAESRDAVLVAAVDGARVVGASTAMPMAEAMQECIEPFARAGYDLSKFYYFGESVLLKPYRGQGIGVRFFEEREAAARSHRAIEMTAFCAVERPPNHPLRPADYLPLDRFWRKRGYTRHPELVARFHWRDIGEEAETFKPLVFWLKRHRG